MKVFPTTAIGGGIQTYLPLFRQLAEQDKFEIHRLTDDPKEADLILFLDGHQHYTDLNLDAIRRHPLLQKYRAKTFVYNELDQPWCAVPGLYVSMPRRFFDWQQQRPCSYLFLINDLSTYAGPSHPDPRLLFSYLGRRCHPVRDGILSLSHPRAHVEDTTTLDFFGASSEEIEKHKRRYADIVRDSKFVICPRGGGLSSFRLFETMSAGRVPVIVSDEWVPPVGPDWSKSAIRVPEANVSEIPALLEAAEALFPEMAQEARRQWEGWFSPTVLFHRMVDNCEAIIQSRFQVQTSKPRIADPRYLYLWARSAKWKLRHIFDQRPAIAD